MTPEHYLTSYTIPAMIWLTPRMGRDMGPPEVLVILGTIVLQEGDGLKARIQYAPDRDNPTPAVKRWAHSFFQFEGGEGAALAGLMANKQLAPIIKALCEYRGIELLRDHIWWSMLGDDFTANVLARLLILTDPARVPMIGDEEGAWRLYVDRLWKPGAAKDPVQRAELRKKWGENYQIALNVVTRINSNIPEPKGKPVATNRLDPNAPLTVGQMQAMLATRQMQAAAGFTPMSMTDKQLAAYQNESFVVGPRGPDGQTMVRPPKGQNTWSRGSTKFAILGMIPMVSQYLMQIYDPLVAAAHSNDYLSIAGMALAGVTLASQRWADRGSFDAAARVATAAVDPVGVTPVAMPLPAPSELSDADLARIVEALRTQPAPANVGRVLTT